ERCPALWRTGRDANRPVSNNCEFHRRIDCDRTSSVARVVVHVGHLPESCSHDSKYPTLPAECISLLLSDAVFERPAFWRKDWFERLIRILFFRSCRCLTWHLSRAISSVTPIRKTLKFSGSELRTSMASWHV